MQLGHYRKATQKMVQCLALELVFTQVKALDLFQSSDRIKNFVQQVAILRCLLFSKEVAH